MNPFVLSVDRGSSNQTMNRQIVPLDAVLSIVIKRSMGSVEGPTVVLGHCVCFSGGCFKAYRILRASRRSWKVTSQHPALMKDIGVN
jgi:hypothetical protein